MASESTKQLMYLSQQVSPTLAAILNFFFPGVGYWYAGYSVIFAIGVFVFVALAAFFTLGLAMVVSDVGSIRDYVDESNGLFCLTSKDFIIALSRLEADRDMVKRMQLKSVSKAQGMNVSEFYRWFRTMVYES